MTTNKSSDAYHKLMNLFERYCYQDPNVSKTRVINKSTFSKSTLKESDISNETQVYEMTKSIEIERNLNRDTTLLKLRKFL